MLTLYSYPELFGVADNNPFGLKVYAFLRLCRMDFRHEHILDTKDAPRGQLPFLIDGDHAIGDSDVIIAHLIERYGLTIDDDLTPAQRDTRHLILRMLDGLYWIMSYSRWKDARFWPLFEEALLRQHPGIPPSALDAAQAYNEKRYYFQGVGRYEPDAVYAKGIADLRVIAHLLPVTGCMFGPKPTSVDAAVYGFVANIWFYDIPTPLKDFLSTQPNIVRHCETIHAAIRS